MRLLILTTSLTGGGAEFVARTWAEWLAASGHDVRVAALTPRPDEPTPDGVRVLRLKARGHANAARAVRALARRESADAVLALQNYPNLVALTAFAGMRERPAVLISERNITARENEPFSIGDRAKDLLARRLYRRADMVVAISHPVAAELVSAYGVPADRYVVVPNPAGRRSEARGGAPRASVSTDPQQPLHLVLPMRLVPQKRAELAVGAAAILRAEGIDARLVCFGRGPGLESLQAAAARADAPLDVPGWSADWVADSPSNSIAVLTSYREGFGNVLVEAALGGIPSVAVSNAYGVADSLVPTVSGALAFAGTPGHLADAVKRAREADPRHVQAWARRFSTDESGRVLVSAIEAALARRRSASQSAPATPARGTAMILASAVGQYDNVGDTVLRRGFLDHLRTLAPLRVYVGDKTDDYISGLGLQAGDVAIRDGREWRGAVSKQLATGGGLYAFDTGETEVQAAFAKRYLKLAPLLAVNRLRGGMAVQLGVGVRESTGWRTPIGAVLRLCDEVSWRDDASRRIMGFGSVTPDWAFALGSGDDVLFDDERPRPRLAIAYRQGLSHAARDKPSERWIDAVRQLSTSLGLEPVTVAQIERDGPLAQELADRLGCEAVVWPDDNHARQEERLRAVYRDSAIVLSDRLHAVVIAATEGAVPIALSAGAMDKTTRTLEGAGILRTSVPRDLPDTDAALAVIVDALARRAEIMRAVSDARVRLRDVTASLGERMREKGLTR